MRRCADEQHRRDPHERDPLPAGARRATASSSAADERADRPGQREQPAGDALAECAYHGDRDPCPERERHWPLPSNPMTPADSVDDSRARGATSGALISKRTSRIRIVRNRTPESVLRSPTELAPFESKEALHVRHRICGGRHHRRHAARPPQSSRRRPARLGRQSSSSRATRAARSRTASARA